MRRPNDLLDRLARAELIVVTGKGGTGKTTVAGLLGRFLAGRGRRVRILEADPRESLHLLFETEPSDGRVVEAAPGLTLENLDPAAVLAEVVREQLRIELLARRLVTHPAFRHVVAAVPGLDEVAALGHALRLVRGLGRRDVEVDVALFDAPATGHGLALLEAPRRVAEAIRSGPFGRMAKDLAGLVTDERRCAIVLVTLAEQLAVQESLEFARALERRLGRGVQALFVNALHPPATVPERPGGERDPALALWRRRRAINEDALRVLSERWYGPRIELPIVPEEPGRALLAALEQRLAAALERAR